MPESNQNPTSCALCDGSVFELAIRAEDHHYGNDGSWDYSRCLGCGLLGLNPMPSDENLGKFYPNTYYSFQDFTKPESKSRALIRKLLLIKLGTLDPVFEKPGRVLDIGCGSGRFLYQMRSKGWGVFGVEPSKAASEAGKRLGALDIFNGNLIEAGFPHDYFDYIRLNHSFEHIANPNEVLDEIRRLLRPGGKLLIGVPNIESLNARFFRAYWWYLGAPVHTYNYSADTLTAMLKKHGFRVERVNFNSDFSGVLGSIQIWLNRRSNRSSTEGFVFNSSILRVLAQRFAKATDILKLGDAIEIISS